jgi:hypothetical protein
MLAAVLARGDGEGAGRVGRHDFPGRCVGPRVRDRTHGGGCVGRHRVGAHRGF